MQRLLIHTVLPAVFCALPAAALPASLVPIGHQPMVPQRRRGPAFRRADHQGPAVHAGRVVAVAQAGGRGALGGCHVWHRREAQSAHQFTARVDTWFKACRAHVTGIVEFFGGFIRVMLALLSVGMRSGNVCAPLQWILSITLSHSASVTQMSLAL